MLISIVSDTYGEVAEKKYLYVYRERVELICDLHAFTKIASWSKRLTYYIINRVFQRVSKFCTGKARKSAIDSKERLRRMVQNCDLLMMAQEDPDNQDTTFDFVNEEETIDTKDKVDDVQLGVDDMKKQLGLQLEANWDDRGVQNY